MLAGLFLPMNVITSDFTMISPAGKNTFGPAKITTLHVSNTNSAWRIFDLQGHDILSGFYIVYVRFYLVIPSSCAKVFTWYKPNLAIYHACKFTATYLTINRWANPVYIEISNGVQRWCRIDALMFWTKILWVLSIWICCL